MLALPEHFFDEIESIMDTNDPDIEIQHYEKKTESKNRKMAGTYKKIKEIKEIENNRKDINDDQEVQDLFEKYSKVKTEFLDG